MKKSLFLLALFLSFYACKTVPFTGRKQLNTVSNASVFPMSFSQYNQFLSQHKISNDAATTERIKRIGRRLVAGAEKYLNANGHPGYFKDYRWEYNLVEDDQLNAFCMPGGKIVFYTGIIPVCDTDEGIATVMGHEIAHAIANHGSERMSHGQLQQAGAVATAVAVSGKSKREQASWMQAFGIGTQIGFMLPFSRKHESEADAIGLTIMAIAGYNPDKAADFWKRMSAGKGSGQAPPEILSTHPSDATRIANINALAPKAKEEARKFGVTFR